MASRITSQARRPHRNHDLRLLGPHACPGDRKRQPPEAPGRPVRGGPLRRRRRKSVSTDGSIGLHKDAIRRIALEKLEVVYRDWNFTEPPFADFATEAGERREDARAFLIALVAGLLGGLSDAIEQNNKVIAAALTRRGPGRGRRDA